MPLLSIFNDLYLIAIFIFIILIVIIKYYLEYKIFDIFSPWISFPLLYFAVYGIGAIRWIYEGYYPVDKMVIIAIGGIIFYYLGSLVKLRGWKIDKYNEWNSSEAYLLTVFILFISVTGFILFIINAGTVPLFLPDKLESRISLMDKGGHYLIYLARLSSFSFIITLVMYLVNRRRNVFRVIIGNRIINYKLYLLLTFSLSFLIMISTACRTDIFFIFIFPLIIYYYYKDDYNNVHKYLILLCILFIGLFVFGYYRLYGGNDEALNYLAQKADSPFKMLIRYIQIQIAVYSGNFGIILTSVPDIIPYMHGKCILTTLSTILPGKQLDVGEYIKYALKMNFKGGGINPTILGELYLDNGLVEIMIGMFIYGIIVSNAYRHMMEKKSTSSIIIYSYLCYVLLIGTLGGILSQLARWYYGFWVLAICFLLNKRILYKIVSE